MTDPHCLPTRFPCWVRAVYSWGGESKKDLGFIEGDLIECLNAGDGSWWMGRLWRDKRMMGLFPSNFVQVLDDNFRPATRASSPLPQRSPSISPFNNTEPETPKAKPFRKPFQSYAAPDLAAAKRAEIRKQASIATSRPPSHSPREHGVKSHAAYVSRAPSPSPHRENSYRTRPVSPVPPRKNSFNARAVSPMPPRQESYNTRAVSPVPSRQNSYNARAPSPAPYRQNSYNTYATSPLPSRQNSYNNRPVSPIPPRQDYFDPRPVSPMPERHNSYDYRAPSPALPPHNSYESRAPSPAPPLHNSYGPRAVSPMPQRQNSYDYRAPSPAPPRHDSYGSRAPSPTQYQPYRPSSANPQFDIGSSPPPPAPPPHKSRYTPHRATQSYEYDSRQYQTPRAPSPCPPSPMATGLTPSPLRDAMDDVMSFLADMGVSRKTASPEPPMDPWSPEAFDQTYVQARRNQVRPNTTMDMYDGRDDPPYGGSANSRYMVDQPPPQLSNYVQRMENRLNKMHATNTRPTDDDDIRPAVPPKPVPYDRPKSSMAGDGSKPKLRHRKSAFEVGKMMLGRTFTTKTTSTNSSSATQKSTSTNNSSNTTMTDRSLMSGQSAGGISATSAGSLARKMQSRSRSAYGSRRDQLLDNDDDFGVHRPGSPATGISFHSSHATNAQRTQSQAGWHAPSLGDSGLGGLVQPPKPKKSGFFKRIVESAKTGAASARSSIAVGETGRPHAASSSRMPIGVSSIAGGYNNSNAASDMGLGSPGSGVDWVQVRRDINRSNSLSRIERVERRERCQMLDYPTISPVEELLEQCDGDEGADGNPVEEPTNFQAVNLSLVDKNARFVNNLTAGTNPVSLATGFVCRPYRSDVQRLRAIFTWVAEKISWEDDFDGEVDARRVIQTLRGCAEEVAVLTMEMCASVGIQCEVIRGHLKTPGEVPDLGIMPRPNHWWNGVIIDGEWRILDCSLASPSHPRRELYSSAGNQVADSWWFLTRPSEICWTHIPEQHRQQHLCPAIAPEILLALPCACPPFFKNGLQMVEYDTSLARIEDLELVHVKFTVPEDIECVAEVEAKAFSRDQDGDLFESGETNKKRALAQAEWINGQKRYTIKALLPGDEGQGTLKVYAGKRGLMHSIKDIPHPLAFTVPIVHVGENPPGYEFVMRHPTPHAMRHDLYVGQPQCQRLALNNTFVFAIRQHPSSISSTITPANPGGTSPIPFIGRPGSAMSIGASSASGSNPSTSNSGSEKKDKPAKLAIQAPGGKVLRLMRKEEGRGVGVGGARGDGERGDGGTWETIIKVGERGVWRGLVLADRSARWCVFAEWECV